MSSYDQQYKEENLFGAPYTEFVAFMETWQPKGTVLDIGCGQGRDSLFLAEQGYNVTAIDASEVGIKQMLEYASLKNLNVTGVVADFYTYEVTKTYDVVVLDSILHFAKADLEKELALLERLSSSLAVGGIICLFVHKSSSKEKQLKGFFAERFPAWRCLKDSYIDYTYFEKASNFKSSFQYHMYFMQNVEG